MSVGRKFVCSLLGLMGLNLLVPVLLVATREVAWVPLGVLVLLVLLAELWVLIYFRKRFFEPLKRGIAFALEMTHGEPHTPLPIDNDQLEEVRDLYRALALIRDRQQNLDGRLRLSYAREQEARHQSEHGGNSLKYRLLAQWLTDLRDPLSNIDGYAMLLNPAPTPERQSYLDGIRRSAVGIHRQIRRMLEVCGLGGDRREPELSTFGTGDLLRQLLEFNSFALQEREVRLVTQFGHTMPEEVCTDRDMLFELLNILLRAAGRSSSPGEVIQLSCFSEKGQVVFRVRDERRSPAREELVEHFLRCRESGGSVDRPEADLVVLGLLFVETQVPLLGGRLVVEQAPEAHAVLSLIFHAAELQPPGSGGAGTTGSAYAASSSEPAGAELDPYWDGRLRVLVGDEDQENLGIFSALSGRDNCEFLTASESAGLLGALLNDHFDAVILSVRLHHGNTVDLVEQLRALPPERFDGVLIVLASSLNPAQRRLLVAAGVDHFLLKPLNFSELLPTLRRWCGRRKARFHQ